MPKNTENKLLTEVELELMVILWKLGQASVREVLSVLKETRHLAYTSAATIIRILETKGFVSSRKDGKTYIYTPLLQKEEYEARSIGHMVNKLFNDAPISLVARLIDRHELDDAELKELQKLINKKVKS